MSSLTEIDYTRLPAEVWKRIIEAVERIDEHAVEWEGSKVKYPNLKNLSMTCRLFHSFAAPLIFRELVITPGHATDTSNLVDFLEQFESNSIARYTRRIDVRLTRWGSTPFRFKRLTWLLEALAGKANLQEFRAIHMKELTSSWWPFVPQNWPGCRIHLVHLPHGFGQFSSDITGEESNATMLSTNIPPGSEQIRSLDYIFRGGPEQEKFAFTFPNLEVLRLRPENENPSLTLQSLLLDSEDKLPPLKELEFHCLGFAPGQAEVWSRCANWEKLEHLAISISNPGEFLQAFTGRVPNLRSFTICLVYRTDEKPAMAALATFLKGIKPNTLEKFKSVNVPRLILPDLAATHGLSLRSLKFHIQGPATIDEEVNPNPEYRFGSTETYILAVGEQKFYKTAEMARYLDRVDIDHMAKNFPRLVTLSYNLDPRGCLARETLVSLSAIPRLTHLELNMPSNIDLTPDNETDIETAFPSIFSVLAHRNWSITSLKILSGDWDMVGKPYRTGLVFWKRACFSAHKSADGTLGNVRPDAETVRARAARADPDFFTYKRPEGMDELLARFGVDPNMDVNEYELDSDDHVDAVTM